MTVSARLPSPDLPRRSPAADEDCLMLRHYARGGEKLAPLFLCQMSASAYVRPRSQRPGLLLDTKIGCPYNVVRLFQTTLTSRPIT